MEPPAYETCGKMDRGILVTGVRGRESGCASIRVSGKRPEPETVLLYPDWFPRNPWNRRLCIAELAGIAYLPLAYDYKCLLLTVYEGGYMGLAGRDGKPRESIEGVRAPCWDAKRCVVAPMTNDLTSRGDFLKIVAAGTVLTGCGGLLSGCGGPALSEKLSVKPSRARSDEPFVVRLRNLSAGQRVVLSATFDDAFGNEWSSTAVFKASDGGEVDTSKQAPTKGSYTTKDPMGLVWAALGAGDFYVPPLPASPVRITAKVGDQKADVRVERYDMAKGVKAEDVRENGLIGRSFSPAGPGTTPGMLLLGGSEGGLSPYLQREAALLASRGYAVLALAYFRSSIPGGETLPDSLPKELVRIPLEYFGRAIRWLGGRGDVDQERLGVVGHSRGAELALLLGSVYPEVKAVVSYSGSGVVFSSPSKDEPAWTYRGKPVPRVHPTKKSSSSITEEQLKKAEIPVEKINGPVLLISGGDDALWHSVKLSKMAMDRLKRHGHAHGDELAVYPKAGHLIQAPYLPTGGAPSRYGGSVRANAEANEDSWLKVTKFLRGALGR